jgi:hypothetical protein
VEIRLLAFADQIEGVAGCHANRFVARRVVNRVLTMRSQGI